MENFHKSKDLNNTKNFSKNRTSINNSKNNLSKSSKSPYNKDKFLKHIKATNISNEFNNLNAKSLSIISENTKSKKNFFQNNFLAQSKNDKPNFTLRENYKSENDFVINMNINRTNTPNTRSLNRDFSQNLILGNKIKTKNNINYSNRDYSMNNILSERDKDRNTGNLTNKSNTQQGNNIQSNTSSNLNIEKKQQKNYNNNLNQKSTQNPFSNSVNLNNTTKSFGPAYQFKPNSINKNSLLHKSINGNLNNLFGNNINLSSNNKEEGNNNNINSLSRHCKNISAISQTIDVSKGDGKFKEGPGGDINHLNKNGLISYMKPKGEHNKTKQVESNSKVQFQKKDSRPKSATGVRVVVNK